MKKIALYPGSFDPITLGHIDIVYRIAPLFDELIILVANARDKKYLFDLKEREALIRENIADLGHVKVASWDGLTVDYAQKVGARVMIRGLRAISDFEVEFAMASSNRELSKEVETMTVFTRPEFSFIASRIVKEIASLGGDVTKFVPKNVAIALANKLKK